MRILYLSRLENEGFAGLTYSVPNQVKAQAQFDTVHWHNLKKLSEMNGEIQASLLTKMIFIFRSAALKKCTGNPI